MNNKENRDKDNKKSERTNPEFSKEDVEKKMKEARESLKKYLDLYLESTPRTDYKTNELEVRFGTKSYGSNKPISKIDYDNVVKQLIAFGFKTNNADGIQMLRVTPEYEDVKTGFRKLGNIRAEIVGLNMIEEYCKTNDIEKLLNIPSYNENSVKFTQKMREKTKDGAYLKPIDFVDMNFRVSYQVESDFNVRSNTIRTMIDKWTNSRKDFRFMNRVRFTHPDYPIFADLSIVRSSKTLRSGKGPVPIPKFTVQEANVFKNPEVYEIEFELDNSRIGKGQAFNTTELLLDALRKCIRVVMSGLQGTNYPIPLSEKEAVLECYKKILYGEEKAKDILYKPPFIGPSSVTLQLENIVEPIEGSNIPNIRNHYTVTEKADGDRALLFVSDTGLIYFIDKNMNVMFTGSKTEEKTCFNSILDGEYIKYGKNKEFINLYAAFDIYFINGKSVREKAFVPEKAEDPEKLFRLPLLHEFMKRFRPISIIPENNLMWREVPDKKSGKVTWFDVKTGKESKVEPPELKNKMCKLKVKCKDFYATSESTSIFNACSSIFSNINDGKKFEYNTDGLIFTPSNTGVGSSVAGKAAEYNMNTWNLSFKWKPAEFNTVDFLVSVVKDKTGRDKISHIYQDGFSNDGINNIIQYKTLELRCGFHKEKHRLVNPFHSLIMGNFPKSHISEPDSEEAYVPMPFQPSNPYDPEACFCNVTLKQSGNQMIMTAEENGEYFEENMIVEFKYDMNQTSGWRWIPLRVRYDKTQKLRSGKTEYGNAYPVANSNWKSIHYPITEQMISSGENIPDKIADDDVYYNKSNDDGESRTRAMRNFHNLFVKRKLITGVANRDDTLIDYAVGKAGDLQKWIQSKLSFVFGIDISRDNIHNELDGACARYLNERIKYSNTIPNALFVNGNSGVNIRETKNALVGEKDKMICKAVFGQGAKDSTILGNGVYENYGVASNGFHISSCQFALHYFFENHILLHGFIRNLAECTRLQGYFVGTCYDGKSIFNMLKEKQEGESVAFITQEEYNGSRTKICEITKRFSDTGFPDDELSIGYPIDVFQETINKTFREYLVNFNFFVRMMENYGFTLVTKEEAQQFGLPNNTGLFNELFDSMKNELEQNPRKKADYKNALNMSSAEKSLSFLNRYFIFRKTTSVKAADIEKEFLKKAKMEYFDDPELELLESQIEEQKKVMPAVRGKIKKLKAKVVLQKFITPIEIREETESEEILDLQPISGEENDDEPEQDQDKELQQDKELENKEKEEEDQENREVLEEVEEPFVNEEPKIKLKKPEITLSEKRVKKKNTRKNKENLTKGTKDTKEK
jgi:hypothetical protein